MNPKIYTSNDHHIRNDLIDPNALVVLTKLHAAGYTAYLVGGGVRDLLMRKKPKDYDISTSARPEEIKDIFRNCILIGRRFRLAHIRFGRQIIEVSTFRAGDPEDGELIVRDNMWGSSEEDVMRRDFTINGLFYDPLDHKIIDYVGGFEDLQKHYLRVIGDPVLRFKQDPVRMIRMQKFRARFGFNVDPEALKAMEHCRTDIVKSSPARVLEEIFKMLESGSAEPFFRLLAESDLLSILFEKFSSYFEGPVGENIYAYLKAVDSMNGGGYRPLDRSILTAALLFPIVEAEIKNYTEQHNQLPHQGIVIQLIENLVHELLFEAFSHFPRRIRSTAQFILQMQFRLTPLDSAKRPRTRIVRHKEFNLALLFLKLRALMHHDLFKSYEHWKKIHTKSKEEHDSHS